MKKLALVLVAALFLLCACSGGPSDSDVEDLLRTEIENAAAQTMGLVEVEIESIDVGDITAVEGEEDTYDAVVTLRTRSTALGEVLEDESTDTVRLKKVNDAWVLAP